MQSTQFGNVSKTYLIASISSDIGFELAKTWIAEGHKVIGTYRNWNKSLEYFQHSKNVELFHMDFNNLDEFPVTTQKIIDSMSYWDNLIIASGSQEPIGLFSEIEFSDWKLGFEMNFISQLEFLHKMLPYRKIRKKTEDNIPSVLFFAGGGTNNSVNYYSAYTVAKIALIKMCEILDSEIPDTKFCILGPGWVNTKIHNPTLFDQGKNSRENYRKTIEMLRTAEESCTPMEKIVSACNWLLDVNSKLISGRNFSVVNDLLGENELLEVLAKDINMYKLRRSGNDWKGKL